eukprot:1779468-Prymnesium_polylepis.1
MKADLECIITLNSALGWTVPDPEPDKMGRERKRKRNKGFILVDPAGAHKAVYCMETKNLKFVRGVDPGSKKNQEYDMVTRKHRAPTAEPPLTLGRALDHFAVIGEQ